MRRADAVGEVGGTRDGNVGEGDPPHSRVGRCLVAGLVGLGLVVVVVVLDELGEMDALEALALLGCLLLDRDGLVGSAVLALGVLVALLHLIVFVVVVKAVELAPDPGPAALVLAALLGGLARPLDAEADSRLAVLGPEAVRCLADDDRPLVAVGDRRPGIKEGVPEGRRLESVGRGRREGVLVLLLVGLVVEA
jgi:hypothetical protein